MKNNNHHEDESILIASSIREWLTMYIPQVRGNSPHTQRAYTLTLRLYVEFLESEKSVQHTRLTAQCFDTSVIQDWLLWLKNVRNCSNSTCNHRLACLRSFIIYLGHSNPRFLEQENKILKVKRMKTVRKNIVEITKKAMKALFSSIDQTMVTGKRDLALFTLMYSTATRINEVLSLRIGDIQLYEKKNHNCIYVMGKGSKRRAIPLMKDYVKIIKSYIQQFHGDSPTENDLLFFSSHNGNKVKLTQEAISKRLKIYARKANGICAEMPPGIHCHNLRAARATHWLEEGLNIVMIQKLLGHESITTTMNYVTISNAQKSEALASLEDDVSKLAAKKWKKVKESSPLAELLGLKIGK